MQSNFQENDLTRNSTELYPKRGKCTKSCFAAGHHRVGMIKQVYDTDGLSGWICREQCVECRKKFKKTYFWPEKIKEPNDTQQ